jgi:hypothetical protein
MAIENRYQYNDENQLIYNIDSYTAAGGSSIEFNGGQASLRNINSDPKSQNFFGNGELGVQVYSGNVGLEPTSLYFRELVANDPLYGNHITGIFGETGQLNIGDEIILYKKHCALKEDKDQVGQWDIVTVTSIMEATDGTLKYGISHVPNNAYTDYTANTATVVLQYEDLYINGICYLNDNQGFNAYHHTQNGTFENNNWRGISHPEQSSPWMGRQISNSTGILFIKCSGKFNMGANSLLWNWKGIWGGATYNITHRSNALDIDTVRQDYTVPACGFLPSPSTGQNANAVLYKDNVDEYAGYYSQGGGSFWNFGDDYLNNPDFANKIPMSLRGASEQEKIFMGMPSGAEPDYRWSFGSDGGGIIIVHAKEVTINQNAVISTSSASRWGTYYDRANHFGAGGTNILKSPIINVNTDVPFLSTVEYRVDTYYGWKDWGLRNPGTNVLEFGEINLYDGTKIDYADMQASPMTYRDQIFADNYIYDLLWNTTDYIPQVTLSSLTPIFNRPEDMNLPTIGEANSDENVFRDPSTTMSTYETNKYYKVYTTGNHNIDTKLWNAMTGFQAQYSILEDTDIKVLFSIDKGASWFRVNTASDNFTTINLADIQNGNSLQDLLDYKNMSVLSDKFILTNTSKTIDVAVGLKTDIKYKTPFMDSISILYEGTEVPSAPVRILPYHEEEFDAEEVDFVWIQPLQDKGSIQNRIEISTKPTFEPERTVISTSNDNLYPTVGGKITLPFQSEIVNNFSNEGNDLVLPYFLERGHFKPGAPENLASWEFDTSSGTPVIDNYQDIYYVKGRARTLPLQTVSGPDFAQMNSDAPLASSIVGGTSWVFNSTNGPASADLPGTTNFSYQHVDEVQQGYLGNVSVFKGGGYQSYYRGEILADDVSNILLKKGTDRTFHFKFNVQAGSPDGYNHLFGVKRQNNNTFLYGFGIYNDGRVYWRSGYEYFSLANNDLMIDQSFLNKEINATVRCDYFTNSIEIFLNGFKVYEGGSTSYLYYPTYVDPNPDTGLMPYDFEVYVGCSYAGTSHFKGSVHEIAIWDRKLSDNEILSISGTPNYHYRYDLETDTYKCLQWPYKNDDYMLDGYRFGEWGNDGGIYGMYYNHLDGRNLPFYYSQSWYSTNESLLLGYVYPQPGQETYMLEKSDNDKHNIYGYKFLRNQRTPDNSYKFMPNNSIYTTSDHNQAGFSHNGRINMTTTGTKMEFVINNIIEEGSYLGIEYGGFSTNNDAGANYWAGLWFSGGLWYVSAGCHYGASSTAVNIPLEEIELNKRYTLTLEPISDTMIIRLHSFEVEAFKDNPIIFDHFEYHNVYITGLTLYSSEDVYNDTSTIATTGIWGDVRINNSQATDIFNLIGYHFYNTLSVTDRNAGYVDNFSITKRIPGVSITQYNKIDIYSKNEYAGTSVKHVISFDGGVTYKAYDPDTNNWYVFTDYTDPVELKANGMTDGALYTINQVIAKAGGLGTDDLVVKTYLFSDNSMHAPIIDSYTIEMNGPRVIDSWDEPGSNYDPNYDWYYMTDNTWNPYIELDTTGSTGQSWIAQGTGVPQPNVFVSGNGAEGSLPDRKVYSTVKIDCLPKGKWYWRVAAYNGVKR